MDLKEVIKKRRAYRALEKTDIDDEIIEELVEAAKLSASCFNNQPWNFVFVRDIDMLEHLQVAISKGNEWTKQASLIIAVFSREEDDCVIKDRKYHLFSTGLATAQLVLRATDMGLVAHPIAGYNESKAKSILNIPEDYRLITLVVVGKHSDDIDSLLSEKNAEIERKRPERKPNAEFVYMDRCNK